MVLDYFARNGAPAALDVNPADHIVEVIQGKGKDGVDWIDTWNESPERQQALETLERITKEHGDSADDVEDKLEYAAPKLYQLRLVLHRLMIQLWRSPVSLICQSVLSFTNLSVGLRLEQDQPAHFCGSLRWFHVLEHWKHLV